MKRHPDEGELVASCEHVDDEPATRRFLKIKDPLSTPDGLVYWLTMCGECVTETGGDPNQIAAWRTVRWTQRVIS